MWGQKELLLHTTPTILAEQHKLKTPNYVIISPFNAEEKLFNLNIVRTAFDAPMGLHPVSAILVKKILKNFFYNVGLNYIPVLGGVSNRVLVWGSIMTCAATRNKRAGANSVPYLREVPGGCD